MHPHPGIAMRSSSKHRCLTFSGIAFVALSAALTLSACSATSNSPPRGGDGQGHDGNDPFEEGGGTPPRGGGGGGGGGGTGEELGGGPTGCATPLPQAPADIHCKCQYESC